MTSVPSRRGTESITTTTGRVAESFHRLASAIDFSELAGNTSKVLAFTSASAGEAKTSTVTRLGATLARQGRRTLIIGADLRRPMLSKRLEMGTGAGLGEVLGGLYPFESCVVDVAGHEGLFLLRAGTVATESSPVDLFRNPSLGALIAEIRPHFDHILIDCPPVLPVVDALEISRVCDGIVLNVFAGSSRLARVERAVEMITQATHSPIIGFVLTGTKASEETYRGDYYYSRPTRPPGELDRSRRGDRSTGPRPASEPVGNAGGTHPPTEIFIKSEMPEAHVDALAPTTSDAQGHGTPIDDITFVGDRPKSETTEEVIAPTGRERIRMKSLRTMLSVVVAIGAFLMAAPAGAQSYEGTSIEDGIFFVPADLEEGSEIEFSISGLEPNSEILFTLTGPDGADVDGLGVEVLGSVAVRAGVNGNFNGEVTLPPLTAEGVYTLAVQATRANGDPLSTSTSFFIGEDSVTETNDGATTGNISASNDGTGALALTGQSSSRTALSGILIAGTGLVLVFAASRRREGEVASAEH